MPDVGAEATAAPTPTKPAIFRQLTAKILGGLAFLLWRPTWELDFPSSAASWGWAPPLMVFTSGGVYAAAFCANAHRVGATWSKLAFYLSVAAFIIPVTARIAWPRTSRWERIWLVLIATFGLYLIKLVRAPIGFVDHDEFLHWRSAIDILERNELFAHNPLLPVSASYPGLEIVTTALASISGLSIFAAGNIVLLFARFTAICALFLLYERVTESSRLAALACMLYMGCSTFVIFNAQFSYESLALALLFLGLYLAVTIHQAAQGNAWIVGVFLCVTLALSATHHITSYAFGGLLLGYALLEVIRVRDVKQNARLLLIAFFAIIAPLAWSRIVGSSDSSYLGRIVEIALYGFEDMLRSFSGDRKLFVAADGTTAPAWQRSIALGAVLLTCLGLACGFLRALDKAGLTVLQTKILLKVTWSNSALGLLTLLTIAYPVSILLRLTSFGWEFGNRMSTIAFIGVGVVVAIAALGFWWQERYARSSSLAAGFLAGILVIGGIISGSGQFILVSSTYRVVADSDSLEPMGINAAKWAHEWLGPNNIIMADRVNRLIFSTYGKQRPVEVGESAPLLARSIGQHELLSMQLSQVDYAVIDMRLTGDLPVLGFILDSGSEKTTSVYKEPLDPAVLLKFSRIPGVSQVFDNGYMAIADVRVLSHGK